MSVTCQQEERIHAYDTYMSEYREQYMNDIKEICDKHYWGLFINDNWSKNEEIEFINWVRSKEIEIMYDFEDWFSDKYEKNS